jgi:hypothetical protein
VDRQEKKNYSPPGWLVSKVECELTPQHAEQYQELRTRLCKEFGKDDEACNPDVLWNKAFELLWQSQQTLLIKVEDL